MTVLRYVEAVVLAAVAFVPLGLGARAWRRRLLPALTGPPGVMATVVIILAATLAVAEALGTVSGFSLAPLTIGLAAVGGAGWYVALRGRPATLAVDPTSLPLPPDVRPGRATAILAVIATSVVTAEWAARTIDALHHGMTTVDTLWYHMPFAARFVQLGSTTSLHYVDTEPVVQFYPANSELLHAVGILFVGNDLLSPLVNMGWMALTLLAAWCIGRRFGVAPVTLIAAALLLGTPGLVATQPGGGYTDVVGLALFLVAIAVLVSTERAGAHPALGGIAVAALAAGLAFGSKFTLVGPVAVLTLGVFVVCPAGRRFRHGGLWLGLVALTGGYWYVRNWVAIGNPLPSLSHLGPITLPSPPITSPNTTFGHYLFKGALWRHYFIPGLRSSFGPAWVVIIITAALGMIFIVFSGRSTLWKMVAAVGAVSVVVFIYTPQFLGLPNEPFYFVYNLRYVTPALIVGMVLLPVVPRLARGRMPLLLGAVLLAALAVTQLDSTIWPGHLFPGPFAQPASDTDSVFGLLIGALALVGGLVVVFRAPGAVVDTAARFRAPVRPLYVGAAALIVVAVLGYPLQQFYLSNRYVSAGAGSVVAPKTVAWAQTLSHTRVALGGDFMNLQYPYYGKYLNNYVQFLAIVAPDGAMANYSTCSSWLLALHRGRYDYVVTLSPQQQRWTESSPGATLIRGELVSENGTLKTYRLDPRTDGAGCGGGTAA